ncbi:DNA alkylation repair protein [Ulvibacterium sp.]|uniref:DNA alkylation repair protein n=1 Tax=Ulvibacterium sp. TaxID=2665914 RepID=UPI002620D2DB|nr:DNA alkylation repair protein [Ulvibacterium sp.]
MTQLKLPEAPNSIQKGVPLKLVLDEPAITQLGSNLKLVHKAFDEQAFVKEALSHIGPLSLKERGLKIAEVLRKYLPNIYSEAIAVLLASLTPPLQDTENLGLSVMFYLPHVSFVEQYGLDKSYNNNEDPFAISMKAQYELTKRFSSEFSIRAFIIDQPDRTFAVLYDWMNDPDPHVRRLCSEGTRPRLPWAQKIGVLVKDPSPSLPILEQLKNDGNLYVRRSVANHVGDIAKDHLDLALELCESWLNNASKELKWVIRHALRHPAKKNVEKALELRTRAK